MIFTCLDLVLVKEDGSSVDLGRAFEWVFDPSIEMEFDSVKGHYNI